MAGRIFITGDKHGSFFPLFGLAERQELFDTDVLLITGDAGYIWDETYPYKVETLHQLFPGTVAFIDGNHENHELLDSFEVCRWNGGKVHAVADRIYHLMRGELYSIYGKTFFAFGGARSVDKDSREDGVSWWSREEPDVNEIAYGKQQLIRHLHQIEYVITHETPLFAREHIERKKEIADDYQLPALLEDWYELAVKGRCFRRWFFGHMHADQQITPQLRGIHDEILQLEDEEKAVRWALG